MSSSVSRSESTTWPPVAVRIGLPPHHAAVVVAVSAALGLAVGRALPWLAQQLLRLSWMPFHGPAELIGLIGSGWPAWVLPTAGVAAGTLVGLLMVHLTPVITVSAREIVVTAGEQRTRIARSQAAEIAIEDGRLVVHDRHDVELLREKIEGDRAALAAALDRYRWTDVHASGSAPYR